MIRLATMIDYSYISHALAAKALPYITPTQTKEDILNSRLYVKVIDGKVVAQCALVPEPNYNYTAMKRMIIYRKENHGKHIANEFIDFFCEFTPIIGATPWAENGRIKHILEKAGFRYQYTFLTNYEFYLKR